MTDILTLKEAAKLLRCSTETVRRRVKAKIIPGRLGLGGWRFSRAALVDYIATREEEPQSTAWVSTNATGRITGGRALRSTAAQCAKVLGLPMSGPQRSGSPGVAPNSGGRCNLASVRSIVGRTPSSNG
ncbi:MAG TPA: DNA-binding protein [Candidatus Competibacteraceae bacterium]|nr:DNA-binding protein [Candidatus Competibacteraceae bacterium]